MPFQAPDAVQLVAPTEDQDRPTDWPRSMEAVLNVSVGAAGDASVKLTEFVTEAPAALVQVRM